MKHIQLRLGHAKLATTMDTYAHLTKNIEDEGVARFEEMLKK